MEGSWLWMPDTQRSSKSSCLGSPSPESLSFTFSPLATGPELLIKDPQNTLSDGQKPWTLETMQVCSGRNAVHTCAEWGLVYQGSLKGPCLWHGVAFTTYGTCSLGLAHAGLWDIQGMCACIARGEDNGPSEQCFQFQGNRWKCCPCFLSLWCRTGGLASLEKTGHF